MEDILISFYEIYYANILNPTLLDLITYKLYKHNKNNRFNKLIYLLDKIKYRKIKHNNKIIEDNLNNFDELYVKTTNEYSNVTNLYRTKSYKVYELCLEDNIKLLCADNHLVYSSINYVETYMFVKDLTLNHYVYTELGWKKVLYIKELNDELYMCDITIQNDEHNYFCNNILSHNTTSVVSYFVWYICFHADRNLIITANKESTTKEILKKCMDVFKGLPYFLKPGIEEYSKTTLRTENGCSLRAVATTGDSATGDSINILLIDECALINLSIIKEFWGSVYPTLSSFELSLIIVLSTPRGRTGLYYELWEGALNGKNGFVSKRVDWWQVPGRDEKWKLDLISVFGQDLWEREFELSFDTNESRLLSKTALEKIDHIKRKFEHIDIYGVPKRVSDKIYWDPDFHPDLLTYEDKILRRFVCIIDTAEGKEAGEYGKEDPDYNVINIFEMKLLDPDIILKNRLGYKAVTYTNCICLDLVGIYIDNNFDEEACAEAALHIAFDVFSNGEGYQGEIDNMRILFERNFNGKNFLKTFAKHDLYYETIIQGFLTTGGNHGKKYFCELGSKLIDLGLIIVKLDHEIAVMSTVELLKSFGKVKNSYAGLSMHDDIAVTVLFASRFFDDDANFEWLDEWFSQLPNYNYQTIEERNKVNTILHYLLIYEYTNEDDDLESLNYAELSNLATSGYGLITQLTLGTYGALMHGLNTSNPYLNQMMLNYPMNNNYYPLNNVQQPLYSGTYSSLRNNITNSRFIRR